MTITDGGMRPPSYTTDRVDLAIRLDDIGEQIEDAMTIAEHARPSVRAPLHQMLATLDEAKRRAAR